MYNLTIYDLQGKLILILDRSSFKSPGTYSKSLSELPLSKGLYIVKLQGSESLDTKIFEVSE